MTDLPDPEINPDDLIRFAETRISAVQDAIARGDSAAAVGHIRDLAAEGSRGVAARFTVGLAETGLRNLATAPFGSEDDENRRWSYLGLDAVRPAGGELQTRRWSAGQERLYLLIRAAMFDAYVRNATPTDSALYRTAADLTAYELIAWDTAHDTRLGPYAALDDEFADDPRGYVVQEITAHESY